MSATGRGPRTGGVFDANYTPAWCVHRLLDHPAFAEIIGDARSGVWLDPCAGDGAIVRAVQSHPAGIFRPGWIVSEIRGECRGALEKLPGLVVPPVVGDFLADGDDDRIADVVLTNPPYRWAGDFLEACSRRARFVCFLLRLGFLESEARHAVVSRCPPDVYLLPQRPSFDGEGVDATTYGWQLWDMDAPERPHGRLFVLDLTPREVRNAGRRRQVIVPPDPVLSLPPVPEEANRRDETDEESM